MRIMIWILLAVLLGGGLILAALTPGVGLIVLLGVVVFVVLVGLGLFSLGRGRSVPVHEAELLGPGGPDDPNA
jgi:hypothetical protein